jgi:cold shock CspA family protein
VEVADVAVVMDEVIDSDMVGQYTGQVKWFSDRLGFGFATICAGSDKGKDIFVHHTGIRPINSNYRTLRKGEYVNFNLTNGHNGPQAIDVTGICGGSLMCDVVPVRRSYCNSTVGRGYVDGDRARLMHPHAQYAQYYTRAVRVPQYGGKVGIFTEHV